LPRYPPVPWEKAIATWKVKPGVKLEFAAHEPQVRDPIALCFDENGRMFVCEMIDYSEMREVTPHLGRISMLEDKDGDGYYETSTVFADDLPWPTALIWANGGLYVGATPDIWRFEDRDGDGHAEVREKIFTGFGTGLKLINVQGMLNSFKWGQDNRIHVQVSGGNRGTVTSLKRPELPALELNGHDLWFDPRTYEFGSEAGGAQFGMSFDTYGRRFACSNSDHLQFFVYDERYSGQNPFFNLPNSRQSIAADGGAAEVFRISPDEPWRIVRTRWRIGGVLKGPIEGGGRVSGYFTGATGTTVYRGDALGADFLNNTFTGDAGGQLVHRKKVYPDGVSLIGRRPDDETNFEFAASTDTWMRAVNFANAPDGCLYICDMYREVIEHPWSIPEEIKQHLDLNSGNDRGRIYRIVPDNPQWQRRARPNLGHADVRELVQTLGHPNGWQRETATRLLYERHDATAVPLLTDLVAQTRNPLAKLHALAALSGLDGLNEDVVLNALADPDEHVRERGIVLAETLLARAGATARLATKLAALADDPAPRVRFQLAFTIETTLGAANAAAAGGRDALAAALVRVAKKDFGDAWISAALLSGPPPVVTGVLFAPMTVDAALAKKAEEFVAHLIEIRAAANASDAPAVIDFIARGEANPLWLRALGEGLTRAGTTIEQADREHRLTAVFTRAATTAANRQAADPARLTALELLAFTPPSQSRAALLACLGAGQPDTIQTAAVTTLALQTTPEIGRALLQHWADYGANAKQAALTALLARDERCVALLGAVQAGAIKPRELSASQVQALAHHKNQKISGLAKTALAAVIPPSRAEVAAKYAPALELRGDAQRGALQYARCMPCHRAAGQGFAVGPDLITVKSKGRDGLLAAILDPNKEVTSQYIAYTINTKDGQTLSGIITKDEASSLTLKMIGGAETTVPRANIKGTSSAGHSLMPEGIEGGMSVQDMADLLTFIEELK
jgi:putative membrane-bound dehydrogenase-like protein